MIANLGVFLDHDLVGLDAEDAEALVRAEGLVRNLDTEIPQVLIESRIIEASFVKLRSGVPTATTGANVPALNSACIRGIAGCRPNPSDSASAARSLAGMNCSSGSTPTRSSG